MTTFGVVAEASPEHEEPPVTPAKVYPLLRAYTVFNVAQIDGLDTTFTEAQVPTWEPEARAEELLLIYTCRLAAPSAMLGASTTSHCTSSRTGRGTRAVASAT